MHLILSLLATVLIQGTWSVSTQAGGTQLDLRYETPTSNSSHSAHVDPNALGIAAALASPGAHVHFTLHHEAGDLVCDGWVASGSGGGTYTFTPNTAFVDAMQHRGYDVRSIDEQMAAANLDITTEYVDSFERIKFHPSDFHGLVAMKALNVTSDYVALFQAAGVDDLTSQNVIALKAMRVDATYLKHLQTDGFKNLSAHEIIRLKAQNI